MNRALVWFGRLLAIAGVLFLVYKLRGYATQIDFDRFSTVLWAKLAGLSLIWCLAVVLLARAWWNLLSYSGGEAAWGRALKIYAASSIAKYVPGNVFQIAGRQSLGMADGITGSALAKSALMELALLATVGASFGAIILPPALDYPLLLGVLLFALALATIVAVTRVTMSCLVSQAVLFQAACLFLCGIVFAGTLHVLHQELSLQGMWPLLIGSFVIAWLVGFITPGAPAGLGVRELVLVGLLGHYVPEVELLMAVTLNRAVSAIGDVLFWLISFEFDQKRPVPGDC